MAMKTSFDFRLLDEDLPLKGQGKKEWSRSAENRRYATLASVM
jgi:hypothetical protein